MVADPKPPPLPPQTGIHVKVSQSNISHSFGIGSIILGVVGLLTVCVPVLSIPLLSIGLMLGIGGILLAVIRHGSGIGFSIAGVAICGLTLLPTVIVLHVMGTAFSEAVTAFEGSTTEARRTNQTVVDASERLHDLVDEPPELPETPKPQYQWADAREVVAQGNVNVSIVSVKVGCVPYRFAISNRSGISWSPYQQIVVRIENTDDNKKLEYTSWSDCWNFSGLGRASNVATLMDNFDNIYQPIDFSVTTKAVGQIKSESIYPRKSITDLLVFDPPVDTVEHLKLELPATAFGGSGYLRFQIDRDIVIGLGVSPPRPSQRELDIFEYVVARKHELKAEQSTGDSILLQQQALAKRTAKEFDISEEEVTAIIGRCFEHLYWELMIHDYVEDELAKKRVDGLQYSSADFDAVVTQAASRFGISEEDVIAIAR